MTERTLSIGNLEDIVFYDDTEFPFAVDTDGKINASQYLSGSSEGQTTTVTVVTDLRMAGVQLQKRTKLLTYIGGLLTAVGSESGWTNTSDIAATTAPPTTLAPTTL